MISALQYFEKSAIHMAPQPNHPEHGQIVYTVLSHEGLFDGCCNSKEKKKKKDKNHTTTTKTTI